MIKFDICDIKFCDDKSGFNLEGLKPLEKRRLGNAAKSIFTVLNGLEICDDLAFVFSSSQGEFSRCISLLKELSLDNFVSPTSFSLSVLNSGLATFGIIKKANSPVFAISSKFVVRDAFACAYSKLNEFEKICVVCYEEVPFKDSFICAGFMVKKGDSFLIDLDKLKNYEIIDLKKILRTQL